MEAEHQFAKSALIAQFGETEVTGIRGAECGRGVGISTKQDLSTCKWRKCYLDLLSGG